MDFTCFIIGVAKSETLPLRQMAIDSCFGHKLIPMIVIEPNDPQFSDSPLSGNDSLDCILLVMKYLTEFKA